MRHATLVELAERDGIVLPDALVEDWPPQLSAADEKGWFRFQRLYDVARSVLRTEDDVRRLVREAAEDDVADGGRWLELQVDPSGYAARFGGITAFTELVLDAAPRRGRGHRASAWRSSSRPTAPGTRSTRARWPGSPRSTPTTGVVGFGLSNDERRGTTADFAPAFAIAERAGLRLVPHGGELLGAESVRTCLDDLHADRLGHGVRVVEDPALLDRVVECRRRPRGVPDLQRLARRLHRPLVGAAAHAARGRCDGRARRRRPAAVRLPAGRRSTPRCGPRTTSTTPTLAELAADVGARLVRRPKTLRKTTIAARRSTRGWPTTRRHDERAVRRPWTSTTARQQPGDPRDAEPAGLLASSRPAQPAAQPPPGGCAPTTPATHRRRTGALRPAARSPRPPQGDHRAGARHRRRRACLAAWLACAVRLGDRRSDGARSARSTPRTAASAAAGRRRPATSSASSATVLLVLGLVAIVGSSSSCSSPTAPRPSRTSGTVRSRPAGRSRRAPAR